MTLLQFFKDYSAIMPLLGLILGAMISVLTGIFTYNLGKRSKKFELVDKERLKQFKVLAPTIFGWIDLLRHLERISKPESREFNANHLMVSFDEYVAKTDDAFDRITSELNVATLYFTKILRSQYDEMTTHLVLVWSSMRSIAFTKDEAESRRTPSLIASRIKKHGSLENYYIFEFDIIYRYARITQNDFRNIINEMQKELNLPTITPTSVEDDESKL